MKLWINLNTNFSIMLYHHRLGKAVSMVSEGKGRLFKRKDGKYMVYLPKDLAEDSMFPFKGGDAVFVKVSFSLGDRKLMVEKWTPGATSQ
jgi:hypothetical protein